MDRRPVIGLAHVTLEYEGKTVLTDFSWKVRPGESWAFIGPNGAGKTSAISIINGHRWPTIGEVEVLGKRFGEADLRELRTHVGVISSYLEGWIPPNERVVDLVVSGKYGSTRMWKRPTAAEKVRAESLLRFVGSGEHVHKKVNELSQGERQKVLIARSMMSKAELLVLDEPCDGLDMGARESFLDSLSKLARERRKSLVYVTHRIDEIPAGFTHALLLKEGRTLASGRIERALTSENLSRCFGVGVRLEHLDGRYYAVVERPRKR